VHEELQELVRESQRFFIPADETLLGAWALIDCDGNSDDNGLTMDMNVVVMLTRTSYYVAEYDDEMDKFTRFINYGVIYSTQRSFSAVREFFCQISQESCSVVLVEVINSCLC
jgi:hypothetical protein